MPPGGEDNQGGGQDIPGQLAPRGASQPRLAYPPGGKLSRGQDKLGHRNCDCVTGGLSALPISVFRNLELEANKLYDRDNKLYKAALLTKSYVQLLI